MEKAQTSPTPIAATKPHPKSTTSVREILDELVLVFVLVMFLKMFIVEHYKIPSGSMTPTLLGGKVAYFKTGNEPGLAYWRNGDPVNEVPLVYSKHDGRWELDSNRQVDSTELLREGAVNTEFDHVLVNRLAYWFHNPRRGDIVVFKVPPAIFSTEAPIYIKRLAGEPGDVLSFTPDNRLIANGKLVDKPAFYQTQHYLTTITDSPKDAQGLPQTTDMAIQYLDGGAWKIDQIRVPPDRAYVFGDNSTPGGSWDSRYWGGVALQNFKGKAFLRVWPLSTVRFLK